MLNDLLPKSATCKVHIVGGEEIEISFRPFTLRDLAWMQNEFDTDEKRRNVSKLKADALCKIIWYMLTPESKGRFRNVKFVDYDEQEQKEVPVIVTGYEKLLHLFASQEDMIKAWMAYCQTESLNNFLPDFAKKKATT